MSDLGTRIKQLRVAAGYTQPQLTQTSGVSNAVVSFWENNINEPKASYVKLLA